MCDVLKGNYRVSKEIISDDKEREKGFEEKAKNSIGGSMVFVEKKKMVWKGKRGKNA